MSTAAGVRLMRPILDVNASRPGARARPLPRTVEVLESRTLLADGIAVAAGPAIDATAGTPITNAVLATYTITDSTGAPGDQWRALVGFGDGQFDRLVVPVPAGNGFAFVDSHTYKAPGTYTVTVMIAIPFSHNAIDNVVTTTVTVTAASTAPTPPPPPSATASGLAFQAGPGHTFRGLVASFDEPGVTAQTFHASIDWGDGSASTRGTIQAHGGGRFTILGNHRFRKPGTFAVAVTIRDPGGATVVARGVAQVAIRARK
jgi:hypothetical protein